MHVCFAVGSKCPTHSLITPDLMGWANISGMMKACVPSQTQWEQVLLCDTYGTIWGRMEATCFWDQTGSFHVFLLPECFLLLPLEAAGIILLTRNQLLFLKPIIGKLVWSDHSLEPKWADLDIYFCQELNKNFQLNPLSPSPPPSLSFLPPTPFAKVQLKLMKNVYFLNGKCLAGLGTIYKTGVWLRQLPTPCLGLIVLL